MYKRLRQPTEILR